MACAGRGLAARRAALQPYSSEVERSRALNDLVWVT